MFETPQALVPPHALQNRTPFEERHHHGTDDDDVGEWSLQAGRFQCDPPSVGIWLRIGCSDGPLTRMIMMWQGRCLVYWRLSFALTHSTFSVCCQHPFHQTKWPTTFARNPGDADLVESLIGLSTVTSWGTWPKIQVVWANQDPCGYNRAACRSLPTPPA